MQKTGNFRRNDKPFEKVEYENTFEVISKLEKGDVTLIAHSGWICEKEQS